MATHSSILAWKIPRTENPGRLELQRDGHDSATEHGKLWRTQTWGTESGRSRYLTTGLNKIGSQGRAGQGPFN